MLSLTNSQHPFERAKNFNKLLQSESRLSHGIDTLFDDSLYLTNIAQAQSQPFCCRMANYANIVHVTVVVNPDFSFRLIYNLSTAFEPIHE